MISSEILVGAQDIAQHLGQQINARAYRQAVIGSSTHFGRVSVCEAKQQLIFTIKAASFPNWEANAKSGTIASRMAC